ncbi:Spc97 / Spc98 family protein [Histomonas meleagridis]|uniref:Spc97 / Spc98 family protein n=1 Tax=Histomonas meleagridis TaxID=135588 RepID=UPI0035596F53|nr:Spc97 / Spc98 family protein [Histomonas meleagridis]KAH0796485.1 Spc97 / Spc98 family protein [Histomonas meleagridis]
MNVETEGVFDSSHFDLFLVDKFVKLAMRNAMSIMMDYVWVPGHLRTLNDFILFFRGDFATSILSLLSNDRQSEALNVLLLSLQSVTNGSLYTNKLTGEHLLDRIDLQMKTGLDKSNVQLSYKVDSPLNFLLNPESISNYRRISQILWKLKCCEYHLSDNWKKSRQQFSFDFDSRLSRLQNTLRHLILTTIHTLNEFVSTDVILVSGRKLEDSMKNVSDIDELLELHQKHIRNLMKSTLLTDEFIEIQNAFGLILDTANKFNDLEDEIESIYDNYIDEIQNTDKFEEESEVIIQRMKNDLSDAYFQIEGLKEEFQNRVNELYELAAQGSNSLELQRLELRLLFCCENKL